MNKKYLDYFKTADGSYNWDIVVPVAYDSYDKLVQRLKIEEKPPVVHSGLQELDSIIRGFEGGRLYVLSAPTKQGKTTLAQTLMYNMATNGIGSLIFSYEMGWQEVTETFMRMDGITDKDEPTKLPMYLPINLQGGGGDIQISWLFEVMAKAKEEQGAKVFFIDHLHFLLPLRDYKNMSTVIGGIVREIKKMAVVLGVAVVLIAHVRKVENDKVPDYMDIRDSSLITQEADVVFMMYRIKSKEAAKKITEDNNINPYTNKTMLSVELNRMGGKTGKVKLYHNGAMFEEYDDEKHGLEHFADQIVRINQGKL
jgi:replicative DNA helicase